jgi:hypothetical protein
VRINLLGKNIKKENKLPWNPDIIGKSPTRQNTAHRQFGQIYEQDNCNTKLNTTWWVDTSFVLHDLHFKTFKTNS